MALLVCASVSAQTSLRGVVLADDSRNPLSGVKVTLVNQDISTTTNQNGEFALLYLEAMDEEVIFEHDEYMSDIILVSIRGNESNDMGIVLLQTNVQKELQDEIILTLSEAELNDDEGRNQSMSSGASASIDVFNKTSSYAWSSARWRMRGYESYNEQTYIMGINFNQAERGMFSFSSMGGLNDASRNKEVVQSIEANNFAFGGLGQSTNYLMDASRFAQGWKVGAGATNRNYKGVARVTYASGLLNNGWAFVSQLAFRCNPVQNVKGIIGEGAQYYSFGYFFAADKIFNQQHKLSLITFGAPTRRGQSAAVTQEVYNLTGSINYNPYWGYQAGKARNSREVIAYDPTLIAAYEWKIDDKQSLKVGLGMHYSLYSNSALTFFNAPDPRPDYYRNLPSFLTDGLIDSNGNIIRRKWEWGHSTSEKEWDGNYNHWTGVTLGNPYDQANYDILTNLWQTRDNTTTQINWDALYAANYANNAVNPNGSARYIVERRHNDIAEIAAHALYSNKQFDHLHILAGLELKESNGIHYKTVDDLLGGNQWIDVDAFADRDIKELASNVGLTQEEIAHVRQNDVANPDKVIGNGGKFGYDYIINMTSTKLWAQNEWNWNEASLYYALQVNVSSFNRLSHMLNGRALYLAKIPENNGREFYYLGKQYKQIINGNYSGNYQGYNHVFVDPAFKVGAQYRINGHNALKVNALAETTAPLARDAYISPRVHDRAVENIYTHDRAHNLKDFYASDEKHVSYDLTYEFNYPIVRGRVTAFQSHFWNGTELNGYYDDEAATFVNQTLTGIDKVHRGIEAAAAVKLGSMFTLTGIASVGDYHYTSNALAVTSAENGMALAESAKGNIYETRDSVMIKGLKVASGPQVSASLKLSFFHSKMWFADLTLSYFDKNYLSYAPSRRMMGLYTGTRADNTLVNGSYKDLGVVNTDENGNILFDQKHGYSALYQDNNYYYLLDRQESLTATNVLNRFMLDASVGKLIYLPNRQSLSINLTVNNLTNNTKFKTGGYQQARLARSTKQGAADEHKNSVIGTNVWKYPAKYYYAWGTNFYLTLTYKF